MLGCARPTYAIKYGGSGEEMLRRCNREARMTELLRSLRLKEQREGKASSLLLRYKQSELTNAND
jgi:hypothetical protein